MSALGRKQTQRDIGEWPQSAPLDPAQSPRDYRGRLAMRALSMRDQQPFRIPSKYFPSRATGGATPEKARSPLAWRAPVLSNQAVESHQHSSPA
jgi:hypothetical protein